MKAAVLFGREDVRIMETDPKPLQPGEVRVAIEAALTCGTDLKIYKRGYHAKILVPPAVFGHEFSGRICELGAGVDCWKVGDPVVCVNSAPCGNCLWCREGQENLCENILFINGAYAESIVIPARLAQTNMLKLKPSTPFSAAALVEPLACVVQGWQDLAMRRGQRVLIIGSGPIGLMFVALATNAGCEVTVAGRGQERLETARKIGASHVIDIGAQTDLVAAIKAQSPGQFDGVVEAVGKPECWQAAVLLVRKGGKVNLFGGCPSGTTVSLDTALVHYCNLTLLATFHFTPRAVRRSLELIETGVVDPKLFVSGECALTQLPELFRSMAAGNRAVKTLIRVKE